MQKNNFCPLPNKVLVYKETDTISQSIFNSKTSKYFNKNNKRNKNRNNPCIFNRKIKIKNITYIKYQKYFEKNCYIFFCNFFLKKHNNNDINKKNYIIWKYYRFKECQKIIPKREYYYRHHLEFLERPNLINIYFNKLEKENGIKRLNQYQIQKKKENSIKKREENNQKIFDKNVLEEIENYSTTITQGSNNEKYMALTPFEIFKRCEENKRLLQKEKNNYKINDKNNENDIKKEKDKDTKSKMTFSESCISNHSKNVGDETLLKIIKDISEKPKKYKQGEKKLNIFFNKRKETIQKITKFNKNVNQKMNGITKFIKKEIKKEKRISTSNNKKNKKLILYDIANKNIINNNSSNSRKKYNASLNLQNKTKIGLNLKRNFYKKRHTINLGDNFKNTINNMNKKNIVSTSITNIDDLLKIILKQKKNKKNIEKQNIPKKKNTALTIINNVFDNNQQKNSQSEEKYKIIKKNKIYKSKSPLIRLFKTINNEKNEEGKIINIKKRKSVLYPEQHNNLLVKSMNFTNRKNINRKNIKQNNAITLSQNFDSIMKNLLK